MSDHPEPRLKTKLWIQAGVRRASIEGFAICVVRSGDPDAGSILIKLNRLENGCVVFSQTYDDSGQRAWVAATGEEPVEEKTADAYVARTVEFDPDLWVIEVEDRDGRLPFEINLI